MYIWVDSNLYLNCKDNAGHQPMLKVLWDKAARDPFELWTGVYRLNETHFTDGNGLWLHADQIWNLHRSCETTACALKHTLYANIQDDGLTLEWSNGISRGGLRCW